MGKLHKLRREIEKDPTKWITRVGYIYAAGYNKKRKEFYKISPLLGRKSYLNFIKHVLREKGYLKDMPRRKVKYHAVRYRDGLSNGIGPLSTYR